MKKYLIIILIFSHYTEIAFTQTNKNLAGQAFDEAFPFKMPNQIDTIYYPFYDGVQMIEVDHIGFWDKKIFFLEQSHPRAMPHSMFNPMPIGNEYFFRDTNGTIVKAFNAKRSLTELTNHFKKVPINTKGQDFRFLSPYHSSQVYREGIWYQSPQRMFNFSGHYKVSTGHVEQRTTPYGGPALGQIPGLKFGLIDSLGNLVIPMEYSNIIPHHDNLLVQKEGKWGMIDYKNKELVPLSYDNYEFDSYYQTINPQKMDNVFFLTSKDSENYNKEYIFNAVFLTQDNKLIKLNNYDELYHQYSRYSWSPEDVNKRFMYMSKNGKKGLLNEDYQEIIPPQFEILEFRKNYPSLYRVSQAGKFGFWDANFREIIPLEYDYAESFDSDSTALVLKNGEFYRIDTKNKKQSNGKLTPEWKTGHLSFVTDKNYISVQTSDILGIVDTSSNSVILPFIYTNSMTPVKINTFFDKNRTLFGEKKMVPGDTPDMISELLFHQNKIIVKNRNNKYGVIDSTFQVLIDLEYENLEAIASDPDYLLYTKNGKTGAMDYTGKNLLSEKYEEVRYDIHYEQERDIFKVKEKGKWGVVNFENETLLPCEYDSIKFLGHWNRPKVKLWVVEKNSKFGVVDDKNEIFIPFVYDGISHLEGYNLWVENKEKKRYKVVLGK